MITKKLLFLFVVSFIFLAGKVSAQTTSIATIAVDPTQAAVDLYDQHKYKESIVEFSKIIKEDPKNGKAFYYRGMAKMHDKQKGFCKDLEESLHLGYSNKSDIYYYGCETQDKK